MGSLQSVFSGAGYSISTLRYWEHGNIFNTKKLLTVVKCKKVIKDKDVQCY